MTTMDQLRCRRPECGLPISQHGVYFEQPIDPEAPEGDLEVETHGFYCPTQP